jgi:hypothetical protein
MNIAKGGLMQLTKPDIKLQMLELQKQQHENSLIPR